MTAPRYPIARLADLANIPDEALPRFYAELPALVSNLKAMREAAPALAQAMRAKAPAPWRWLPLSAWTAVIARGSPTRMSWIDDDKGTITLNVRSTAGAEPFYSQSEKL